MTHRTVTFRAEPTVRQTELILSRIAEDLARPGASVSRVGHGKLRFRMPAPWRARHLGVLLAITSGRVSVSAGAGGPRRLRYDLSFAGLRTVVAVLSVAILVAGWGIIDRKELIGSLLLLWVVAYGLPYYAASRRFRRIIHGSAREVVERRRASRPPTPPESPDPAAPDPPPP